MKSRTGVGRVESLRRRGGELVMEGLHRWELLWCGSIAAMWGITVRDDALIWQENVLFANIYRSYMIYLGKL